MLTLRCTVTLLLAITYKAVALDLLSPVFENEGIIPFEYSCDGDDISVPLSWLSVPFGTQSFALTLVDPDAVLGADPPFPWVHWIIYNIPATADSLQAGIPNDSQLADGSRQGLNSYGVFGMDYPNGGSGWAGMCPLPLDGRVHTYPFVLYALNTFLDEENLNITGFQEAIAVEGRVLESTTLTGYFQGNRMQLTSPAFAEGGTIPEVHSCNGDNISPPLQFGGIPEGAASLALVLQDPYPIEDIPDMTWTHWVWYNNSAPTAATDTLTNVSENVPHLLTLPDGSMQGLNSWGTVVGDTSPAGVGWGGPCPNPGDYRLHSYPFTLYAFDALIPVVPDQNMTADMILSMAESDSLIYSAVLTGYYQVPDPDASAAPSANPLTVPAVVPVAEPVPIPSPGETAPAESSVPSVATPDVAAPGVTVPATPVATTPVATTPVAAPPTDYVYTFVPGSGAVTNTVVFLSAISALFGVLLN